MSVEEPVTGDPSQRAGGAAQAATATASGGDGGGPEPAAIGRSRRDSVSEFLAKYGVLVAFVVMVIVFSIAKPDTFPTWENTKNILTAAAPALIVAAGLTVPLVMQDFDLSFGAMVSLAGGAAVALMAKDDVGWALAILAGLALGLAAGVAQRLPHRLPGRTLVHHHAGHGHRPDRRRVRRSPARTRSSAASPRPTSRSPRTRSSG